MMDCRFIPCELLYAEGAEVPAENQGHGSLWHKVDCNEAMKEVPTLKGGDGRGKPMPDKRLWCERTHLFPLAEQFTPSLLSTGNLLFAPPTEGYALKNL